MATEIYVDVFYKAKTVIVEDSKTIKADVFHTFNSTF